MRRQDLKILIADDEELIRFTIKDMIKDCGVAVSEIVEAGNGRQMIEEFQKSSPDLVLADIRMPGLSGLDAMEELSQERGKWVILTGHSDFEYARRALKLGALDYLLKPPSVEELCRVLNKTAEYLKEEQSLRQRELEHSLTALVNDSSSFEYEEVLQEEGRWSGWLVTLPEKKNEQEAFFDRNEFIIRTRERLCEGLWGFDRSALINLEQGSLFLCLFSKGEQSFDPARDLESIPSNGDKVGYHSLTENSDFIEFSRDWKLAEQELQKKEKSDDNGGTGSVLVDRALRIINRHFQEDIGIAQVAYQLEVTPNYLSSQFRKYQGIPFSRFLTIRRLDKARQLLKTSNMNVKEIASELGYKSSRHFATVFKQEEGISPTDYIREHRV